MQRKPDAIEAIVNPVKPALFLALTHKTNIAPYEDHHRASFRTAFSWKVKRAAVQRRTTLKALVTHALRREVKVTSELISRLLDEENG